MLSSLSSVKDLLEMRGEYYSDRPYRPMMDLYALYRIPFSTLTILDPYQGRIGMAYIDNRKDGDLAQGTKDIGWQSSTWCNYVISAKDTRKDIRVSRTSS